MELYYETILVAFDKIVH